ncbi:hypothetical protein U8527_11715 [Kordia algicida OT-1]|uniref:Uncharacterized protein n=1 Tax=Kordia algicida OT-1 TaxID=391587 RepID=A9DZZ7_9FLAO|nr:hypothetical protein [Kordia algicida]EDP95781.1 hypothetical protein KAOT1_05237 [Kordia algicida OT-1]
MENVLLIIVALLVGIVIGYLLCKKLSNDHGNGHQEEPPNGIIPVSDAVNLHETFVNEKYPLLSSAINSKETQFVWFEFDRIKSYINYLETVEKKNPNNPRISGVRVYFGAYQNHPEYTKQQTVFFNPTIETSLDEDYSNMKNLPFYIQPKNSSDPIVGRYKIIADLLLDEHNPIERAFMANNDLGHKESKENMVQKSSPKNGNGTSLSFNDGQLSPPPPRG